MLKKLLSKVKRQRTNNKRKATAKKANKTTLPSGTLRIKARNLKVYEKTAKGWKRSKIKLPEAQQVIKLFKAHHRLSDLRDTKDPQFLKGMRDPQGNPKGARLTTLPDGTSLNAAYSLFAKKLTVHDQTNHDHWDVLYQNKGGTFAYLYSKEKKAKATKKKYRKVHNFAKHYPKLQRSVNSALKNYEDPMALPMYTLLHTKMRIGNEIYFKQHQHKGLSTIKKKDITLNKKKQTATFKFIGKDGVPQNISKHFPAKYLQRLAALMRSKKRNDFVFATKSGRPLPEKEFKKAFHKYCGEEFYPHIVRSHYATEEVKKFLKGRKSASKAEVNSLFLNIAKELGHKHYNKKHNVWEERSTVTVKHYIQPELVEKARALYSRK